MQLLRLHALNPNTSINPVAITIGNFDGVHLGHIAMINTLKDLADQKGLKTMLMLFEPQPQEFFKGADAPPRIYSWREKVEIIKQHGIDYVVTASFNHKFRSLSADDFTQLLKQQLNVKAAVVGDDFRFGCDRKGDINFLQSHGLPVQQLHSVEVNGARVSSTWVRECLTTGDFATAQQLLGRPYRISGVVQYGDQIGRTLNFPTVNIVLNRITPCLKGVYAVAISFKQKQQNVHVTNAINLPQFNGVLGAGHVGKRPAISQVTPQWRFEVHVLNAQQNLYGTRASVQFLQFIHGELNYPNLQALSNGIAQDVTQIKQLFGN